MAVGPHHAGAGPHRVRTLGVVVALAAAPLVVSACQNSTSDQVEAPVVLGMTTSTPYYYSDENLTMYEVQTDVALPVRKPTSAEAAALGKQAPYPRAPFLRNTDEQIEVRYTISNMDKVEHNVELLLDPWNEFVRYNPGIQIVDDDDTEPNLSGYDQIFVVPPLSRIQGTLTNDDTNELAVDLATAMAVMANPPGADASIDTTTLLNHIFELQNRSNDGDPLIAPYLPTVIAGLTGWTLGLRTYEPALVAVEITVDAVDLNGDRFVQSSSDTPMGKPGTVLEPPGARGAD